jgi:hypothetical protein
LYLIPFFETFFCARTAEVEAFMTSFGAVQATLLEHRDAMRTMVGILHDADWYDTYESVVEARTGNTPLWLGACSSECGSSCQYCAPSADAARIKALEDENIKLRRELQDRQNFIVAVASMVAKTHCVETTQPVFDSTLCTNTLWHSHSQTSTLVSKIR